MPPLEAQAAMEAHFELDRGRALPIGGVAGQREVVSGRS